MKKLYNNFITIKNSVSGPMITVNGDTSARFFGVVDTTALQFAIMAYINGDTSVAGRTSVFNGPDTGPDARIPQNANPEAFWNQYFALLNYYNCNLVRIGAGDTWGTDLQYQAYVNHRAEYFGLLDTMLDKAEKYGVWVVLVLAGSQSEPEAPYSFGAAASDERTDKVFSPGSDAFDRYIDYSKDIMTSLEGYSSLGWYDLFNEPDHDKVNQNYWHNDKAAFNTWARAVAVGTINVTAHPRTMGVAGFGTMFGWGQEDFNLATGNTGFEIAHRHYYGSSSDKYLFSEPEQWARNCGVPLFWGELANNADYPLERWTFGEQAIFESGGQAVTAMVLNGTPEYPYMGSTLP